MLDNAFAMHGSASSSFHLSTPLSQREEKTPLFSNGRYLNYVGFREDGSLPEPESLSDAGWRSQVKEEEPPLSKLFVSILQRLGVETDSFAGAYRDFGTGLNWGREAFSQHSISSLLSVGGIFLVGEF